MDWIQSIQHALNYIENHLLDEELDNNSVAKHSYSSNANFQRTFSIVTGVTIADYIRCRRLTLAGEELAKTDSKVIDAALKYRYDSPESFSKAFARFHGITPSEAKRSSNNLKCFAPIFLRIEVRGGLNMNTKMIPHIPRVFFNRGGENYHFNSAARYVMDCIGEMKFADYSLIAGITGDSFVQFYSLKSFKGDSASDYYLGLRKLPSVFDKLGYTAESISIRELQSEKEKCIKRITASIDKGVPVILYHGGPPGVIVGYEGDGATLLYLRENMTEPKQLVLDDKCFENEDYDTKGWVVTGNKNREVPLKQIYREAVIQLPKLLTLRTDDYVFGAEAFRMWANDIEDGKFDKVNVDFFTYEVYVLNLATNSGGSQEFLDKAQELNPDFTFLEDVRKQYRMMNYLWNGGHWIKDVHSPEEREEMKQVYGDDNLEALGGAFGCKNETLQDKEKRDLIVKQIRRFADCMGEVVRILNDNLKEH
ncbi:helix-turn-helix domain-containing protein [Gorillibacterium timonense]|uniref:helix-turn-helix domain-containing protein n=1 Tax=Gorillibacterium timonense TaxID=1689269 RepID=UPI00071D05B2|nr:helix-turn-helix domain-containing protein [Gorillibacterium timonense]